MHMLDHVSRAVSRFGRPGKMTTSSAEGQQGGWGLLVLAGEAEDAVLVQLEKLGF